MCPHHRLRHPRSRAPYERGILSVHGIQIASSPTTTNVSRPPSSMQRGIRDTRRLYESLRLLVKVSQQHIRTKASSNTDHCLHCLYQAWTEKRHASSAAIMAARTVASTGGCCPKCTRSSKTTIDTAAGWQSFPFVSVHSRLLRLRLCCHHLHRCSWQKIGLWPRRPTNAMQPRAESVHSSSDLSMDA